MVAAEEALNVLSKSDIAELKAYTKPPALVELALAGVMTALRRPPSWEEAKRALSEASFLERLLQYDKDALSDTLLKSLARFTSDPNFTPEVVGRVSGAARGLCMWVRAICVYGGVARDIAPRRARLAGAQSALAAKQASLADGQAALAGALSAVAVLREEYERQMGQKRALEAELANLRAKLARAERLMTGFKSERLRWEDAATQLEAALVAVPGDAAVASTFLSYAGPFPADFRVTLADAWHGQMTALGIPVSSGGVKLASQLADAAQVQAWHLQGLPEDSFSVDNAIMVSRCQRWPLLVDPQGQAMQWLKQRDAAAGLLVVDAHAHDLLLQLEVGITGGTPVILQDADEAFDPGLGPLLARAYMTRGRTRTLRLRSREVEVAPGFRLAITTRLSNPVFTAEVAGQSDLTVTVTAGQRLQGELEDQVLTLLAGAHGSLLEDSSLIDTLDVSKATWESTHASLQATDITMRKVEAVAAQYRPAAVRAAGLYFVLAALDQCVSHFRGVPLRLQGTG
ncbi:hypothetical protein WJX81_002514 [Elliptochloris bilobata]|uniref:Dynein heavy chain n=1 Tax=Elliptochloris bilobata TaxID=381761 RepID=A0AAW1SJD3_9CHLO